MRKTKNWNDPKKLKDEILPLAISAVGAGCVLPLYGLTTQGSSIWNILSAMLTNSGQSFWGTKLSVDDLKKIFQQKKYAEAAFIILFAVIMYAPQVIITITKSPEKWKKYTFGTMTFLAGIGLYAYSTTNLLSFCKDIADWGSKKIGCSTKDPQSETIEILRKNLERAQRIFSYVDLTDLKNELALLTLPEVQPEVVVQEALQNDDSVNERLPLTDLEIKLIDQKLFLSGFLAVVDKLPPAGLMPEGSNPVWDFFFKPVLQLSCTVLMLLGSTGYMCSCTTGLLGIFQSIGDDQFSEKTAIILGNLFMACQYILNIKAGVNLIPMLFDSICDAIRQKKLPNEFNILHWSAKPLILLAPLFACLSGLTSRRLYQEDCPLVFPSNATGIEHVVPPAVVDYAARGFNTFYLTMAAMWWLNYCVGFCGSKTSLNYICGKEILQELQADLRQNPDKVIDQVGSNPSTRRLLDAGLYGKIANRVEGGVVSQNETTPLIPENALQLN